ncbi:hypothetical protein D9623_29685 [Azospirillum brasilense]|uniref:Uncharacterized protein n=2 Tax=Azospirillum TaxID=191 RepID=A0A4D8QWI7_AZOBR|nr:hypothetical protein [Azospirillum brasilense]NUB20459.1 hypothetical protein [Azospirillum formosense]QCO13384.1 hypothetical protein D3868_30755 [Azospirillum brasilense]QEL94238.1 hypothetical protein D9621_29215 [Azospirillum brasilense]QEM00598.1 hypothetical protein D9623_29685 [Azospirillum brasilense]
MACSMPTHRSGLKARRVGKIIQNRRGSNTIPLGRKPYMPVNPLGGEACGILAEGPPRTAKRACLSI